MKAFETTIKPLVKFGEGSSLCAGEKFKLLGCTKVLAGYDANINPAVVDAVIGSIEKEGMRGSTLCMLLLRRQGRRRHRVPPARP